MYAIMNPPFCRGLHLKVLNEVMKHCCDVVVLAPASQLFAPTRLIKPHPYVKSNPIIAEGIQCAEFIHPHLASSSFGAALAGILAITHYTAKPGSPVESFNFIHPELRGIFNKTVKAVHDGLYPSLKSKIKEYGSIITSEFPLTVPEVHGHYGCDDCYEVISKSYERALKAKQRYGWHLEFNSEEERRNCYDVWHLPAHQFIHSLIKFDNFNALGNLPYLGDYTHPWTDQDLYSYFGLTHEEIEIIEAQK